MFHLMKKDKDKEKEKDLSKKERDLSKKEKKDKREKKERMSQSELKSLEEMSIRRGFFPLSRGNSKKESRSKLEISSPIPIKVASNTELCLTDAEHHHNTVGQISASTSEDVKGIELESNRSSVKERAAKFGELAKVNTVVGQRKVATLTQVTPKDSALDASELSGHNWTTPSTKLHPSSKGTITVQIPDIVEKTFPGLDLQLPALVSPPVPYPRELELQRRSTGDFGFSLRRTTMVDRQSDGGVSRRVVHFAEPGVGTKDRALGLVPGDKLVEINGINVENKNRDEIVEMIRQSGESVRLKVQPILELSELNRSWLRTSEDLSKDVSSTLDLVCCFPFWKSLCLLEFH